MAGTLFTARHISLTTNYILLPVPFTLLRESWYTCEMKDGLQTTAFPQSFVAGNCADVKKKGLQFPRAVTCN